MTSADLGKITFLEWCIKEAMRIYPSVPIFGRSLTRDTVFGKKILTSSTSNITGDLTKAKMSQHLWPQPLTKHWPI